MKVNHFMTFSSIKVYLSQVESSISSLNSNDLASAISVIQETSEKGKIVWIAGNGGSALTASHFATDLGRCIDRQGSKIKSLSITDNSGILTAIANDFSFEEIFSRQLSYLASENDLLIVISASGNSKNLLKGIEYAKLNGIKTLAISGFNGGLVKDICDYSIHTPTSLGAYGIAEDSHSIICHFISSMLH